MTIEELIATQDPGEHVAIFRGDPKKKGTFARWGWECRCGVKSGRDNMMIGEAQRDFIVHKEMT